MIAGWQGEKKAAFSVYTALLLTKFQRFKFACLFTIFWRRKIFVRCSDFSWVWHHYFKSHRGTVSKSLAASYGYEITHTRIRLFLFMNSFAPYSFYITSPSLRELSYAGVTPLPFYFLDLSSPHLAMISPLIRWNEQQTTDVCDHVLNVPDVHASARDYLWVDKKMKQMGGNAHSSVG